MSENDNLYFLDGGGEMARLLREKNWEATPLGPAKNWSQPLRTTLANLLNSLFPMFLFWGGDLICFYNDAYRPSLGNNGKHPSILGKGARESWPEIWDDIGPMISEVMDSGHPIYHEDRLLPIFRNGRMEDVYWTFCYSPVRDASGNSAGVLVVCTETTEAVRAIGKLTESEQRFRTMAEGTSMMIAVGDEKGNAIYFNRAWSEFTGKKMDPLLETGWSELIHPDERERILEIFEKNLEERKEWQVDCRLLNDKGEYRWITAYISPRFRSDGTFVGYVSSAIDTHQRRVAEQQASKFQFIADRASDPFVLMRSDGSFDYLNPAALKKWGYTKEEAESLRVPDVDSEYHRERFEALFARAQEVDVPIFETVHRSKNGDEFPVEAKVSGFSFNGKPHLLAITRDISERKMAETALRESEHRFRELSDQSPMWVWITDVDVNVEYANRELLDYIGMKDVSDFTGKVWKDIVHAEDIGIVSKGFEEAVKKRTVFSLDCRVRNAATGIYEWFTIKGVPRFEATTMAGFIGTGMNVHRQKTFSEQLRKEVDLRTKELADTNEELQKMNKELQSFAYISSHDLQEPLRKIQTFSSWLLDHEYDKLSERGRDKFGRMQSAAKRMQGLIQDLLAYSRLDMEERHYETVDLSSIVNQVKADLADEIEAMEAKVILESSREIEVVQFQFRQLLYNLISNSLKYAKEGEPPVIRIDTSLLDSSKSDNDVALPDGRYVHIMLTDNGIGFDNDYSEKIFEVFQRLHGREKYRGTGVGLSIVKKIVENHRGFVRASGETGKGAVFEVYLPENQPLPN